MNGKKQSVHFMRKHQDVVTLLYGLCKELNLLE